VLLVQLATLNLIGIKHIELRWAYKLKIRFPRKFTDFVTSHKL